MNIKFEFLRCSLYRRVLLLRYKRCQFNGMHIQTEFESIVDNHTFAYSTIILPLHITSFISMYICISYNPFNLVILMHKHCQRINFTQFLLLRECYCGWSAWWKLYVNARGVDAKHAFSPTKKASVRCIQQHAFGNGTTAFRKTNRVAVCIPIDDMCVVCMCFKVDSHLHRVRQIAYSMNCIA